MISLFWLAHKRLFEEAQANIGSIIPFAPEYADDGFSGGAIHEILKLFQEEFRYGLRSDFNLNNCFFIFLLGMISVEILVPFKSWGFELTLPIIFIS